MSGFSILENSGFWGVLSFGSKHWDCPFWNFRFLGSFSDWKFSFLLQCLNPNMYLFIVFQHGLPNLKCSEEDCLADFVLQRVRHKNEISWFLFVGISKCHADTNKMHAQMGYKNTVIKRKRDTRHSGSVFWGGRRTGS
jgi:hypothetical protein